MNSIQLSEQLDNLLKNVDFNVIIKHYMFCVKKFNINYEPVVCLSGTDINFFQKHYLSKTPAELDSLFLGSSSTNLNWYYFSCMNGQEKSLILLCADSEEILLKLFDPKLMVLI